MVDLKQTKQSKQFELTWLDLQLKELLKKSGHALLLQGASGLGQFQLAHQLAKAFLCEKNAHGAEAGLGNSKQTQVEQQACNQCKSCHAVDIHAHPDLCVLLPEALQIEWGWPRTEAESSGEGKRKPSREIRVEEMRNMIAFAQSTNARGQGKVVIIYPAENMNGVTANALLKTLEEPPGDTRFILASEASHRLLPTIRSRCHIWNMHWPKTEQAVDWLCLHNLERYEAERLLQVAGGRPQDALDLSHLGMNSKLWDELPLQLQQGKAGVLSALQPSLAILILLRLSYDLTVCVAGAAPRFFPSEVINAVLSKMSNIRASLSRESALIERFGQWSQALMQMARTSEHPFAQEIMTTALVEQARATLR